MKTEIFVLSLAVLVSCAAFDSSEKSALPVSPKYHPLIIYDGSCKREDIDPEILNKCVLLTCWKSPETGQKAMQTFGCNEDVPCNGLLRNDVFHDNKEWPECCPSPTCVDESVWRISH